MSIRVRVGIFGASGYTGQELLDLIAVHPYLEVIFAVSDRMAGQAIEGHDGRYIHQNEVNWDEIDLAFLCTPHLVSAPLAQQAQQHGVRVVDLSADLRLKSAETFRQWYHEAHPSPEMLPIPYGLPELNRQFIAQQQVIANPGCYPTATLLGLAPLALAGALQAHAPIIVDAKSGVTGAGANPKAETHFVEVYGDLKPYNIGRVHRHVGEIEQELKAMMSDVGSLIFTPHLLPVERGILATIYAPLAEGWTAGQVMQLYCDKYEQEPLIKVLAHGKTARLRDAVRTNGAVLSLHFPTPDVVLIVSAIDNLRKGASSQAIQNANLMFGMAETAGLV